MSMLGAAYAQLPGGWGFECIDPANTAPRSDDHDWTGIGNSIFRAHMGLSGTVTFGGADGPCFAPTAATQNLIGRFGFMYGSTGSIQDLNPADPANSAFRDNFLILTPGMPQDMSGPFTYAAITRNGARTRFGSAAFSLQFVGQSDRYFFVRTTLDSTLVELRVDVVADAARFQWTMTNTGSETAGLGLWFGSAVAMLTQNAGITDRNGASVSHWFVSTRSRGSGLKAGYVHVPVGRPPISQTRYSRVANPSGFPDYVDFLFGQTAAFGMRISNVSTPSTPDATDAAEFVLGTADQLLGSAGADGDFPDVIIPDTGYLGQTAFIQKFPEVPTLPGQTRRIVHYVRTNWGLGNYEPPYAVVVDAPQLVATTGSGLSPNPLTIRVYVDNVGGYATVNESVPLPNARVTLTLPPGLSLATGEPATKTISVVPPREIRSVDFSVVADGTNFGDLPFRVVVEPDLPITKRLDGIIKVATTPRLALASGPNLVGLPWTFSDTAWTSVLSPLTTPGDFRAFNWDPVQQGYVVSTSAERGRAAWILTSGAPQLVDLQSNPTTPGDIASGNVTTQLLPGWNLISNPYPYEIVISQILGVTAAVPTGTINWNQLVQQGILSGIVFYYDPASGGYMFEQGDNATLKPNRGYWLFNATSAPVTLFYPPVFAPGVPGSTRSTAEPFEQSDRQWRLQLAVRSSEAQDAQNFIGQARTAAEARRWRAHKPPMPPQSPVSLAIEQTIDGRPTRLAKSLIEGAGRKEWKVVVSANEPGTYTVNWPNLSTVPRNVRFRLTDLATGTVRDLRTSSGYTFTVEEPSTREFTIDATVGGVQNAVIGNVIATRPSRDPLAPFTINYTLSADATTTVRILSSRGREVFTASRGRSDRAGENTVTWTLRDNANRLVAPGSYRVEVVAETASGERVRKIIPVNVVR